MKGTTWQLRLLDRGHDTCGHWTYWLSCEEYEALLARSGGFCELCGMPGFETPGGKLVIDHDPRQGQWAVRGLLCQYCNQNLHRRPPTHPAVAAYLHNAWFLTVLRRLRLKPWTPIAEPEGDTLLGPGKRRWKRTGQGWLATGKQGPRHPQPWTRLVRKYGPHNLEIR